MLALAPATMDMRLGESEGGSRGSTMLRFRELFADVQAYVDDPTGYGRGSMRDLSLSPGSLVPAESVDEILLSLAAILEPTFGDRRSS